MTLAEKLAAKRAAAGGTNPPAAHACRFCSAPADGGEYDGGPCCLDCYKSGKAKPGLLVAPDADAPRDPLPVGGGWQATSMAKGRRLASQEEGEPIPLKHDGDAGVDAGWKKLAHSLETELCIVIGPGPKDEAWLAVSPKDEKLPNFKSPNPPLLICRLPLLILPGTFEPF